MRNNNGANLLDRKSPNGSDYYQTPAYATELLYPYIDPNWVVWEPAAGLGAIVKAIVPRVKKVVVSEILDNGFDFLEDEIQIEFDAIITNPPFSLKDEFLFRCYQIGKPFALLMPLTALEGMYRHKAYRKYGIQLIIPNRRVNFIEWNGRKTDSYWFPVAWFTWGLLDRDLVFVEMENK